MKKVSKPNNASKTPKTSQPITQTRKRTIIPYNEELHKFLYSHREKPVNDRYIEEFAKEMVDWALHDEDALKITQFYNLKVIHNSVVDEWRKRNEVLSKAHAITLQVLGARRELGAIKGKLDSGIVRTTMAIYEKEWKDIEEWRSGLSKKEDINTASVEAIKQAALETLRDLTSD